MTSSADRRHLSNLQLGWDEVFYSQAWAWVPAENEPTQHFCPQPVGETEPRMTCELVAGESNAEGRRGENTIGSDDSRISCDGY